MSQHDEPKGEAWFGGRRGDGLEVGRVRVALAGIGNCASALVQGAAFYAANPDAPGLMTRDIGPYGPGSVEIVAAFDVNDFKVGADLYTAIHMPPNVHQILFPLGDESGVIVQPGPLMDGIGESMATLVPGGLLDGSIDAVAQELVDQDADVLVCFLPVGAEVAARAYARAALAADVAFVNGIPVLIANDPDWADMFESQGLPLIGDDVKSQVGATITHRALVDMMEARGVSLDRTYQQNFGGMTGDFVNMKDEERLGTKRHSKTRAVTDVANGGRGMPEDSVAIGPSGVIPWLQDEKIAYIRLEGTGFAGNGVEMELRYSGGDSPNSAGVIYDAVRWAKLARDRGEGGVLEDVCGWLMKAPPVPMRDEVAASGLARRLTEARHALEADAPRDA